MDGKDGRYQEKEEKAKVLHVFSVFFVGENRGGEGRRRLLRPTGFYFVLFMAETHGLPCNAEGTIAVKACSHCFSKRKNNTKE